GELGGDQALREGGSLPAIVEADDGALYVLKFRGAGQGPKALIAELIGGEIARTLGLPVPELVFMDLDASFSRMEGDEEIQDLLRFSVGLNLGMTYLSGAITYDPQVSVADGMTASLVVLLDSLLTNVDRTARNTNLLNWQQQLWLIDHGASLYFHHGWHQWERMAQAGFPPIRDHVLLDRAVALREAAGLIRDRLRPKDLTRILALLPADWLAVEPEEVEPEEKRDVYRRFLDIRLDQLDRLTQEAEDARQSRL
ncbi:MAG: aminotransferase class I and II, partial [Bacteroidetes bacterium]